jgi:hypothetical protein
MLNVTFLIYMVRESIVIVKKSILMDLHVFSTLEYENAVFGMLPLWLSACMCAMLTPEQLDGF